MDIKKKTLSGSISVSESVIIRIAEVAATEIDGVYSIGQALQPANTKSKVFGTVHAKMTDDTTALSLDIVVMEGFNAVTVAENVQQSVKSAVQNMTGLAVTKVDVNIAGIKFK